MIVLTGSSGGIGKELLNKLSSFDNVIGIYNKHKPVVDSKNKKITLFKMNLSDYEQIKKFVNKNLKKEKKLTLIHLASIKNDNLLVNQDIKEVKNIFDVNIFAPFIFAKYVLPIMAKNNWGRVIFFSCASDVVLSLVVSASSNVP